MEIEGIIILHLLRELMNICDIAQAVMQKLSIFYT